MKTQWQEIKSIIDFNGISVRFDHYLKAWSEYGPNHIKRVSSKSNFYNTGPTAFDRKEGYKLTSFYSEQWHEDTQIFSIWFRNDGMSIRVFKWIGTEAEYDNFVPDDHTPYAIAKEIGL